MKKTLPALAALALLAGCSSNDDPAAPPAAENGTDMLDVTNDAMTVPEAPVTMNVPEAPAINMTQEPEPTVDEREQIQADADATGMTARVNRDEDDTAPAANQSGMVSEEK